MREKLIELIGQAYFCNIESLADQLIANDVVPVVRCKDCKRWKYDAKKMAGLCKRHINYTTKWDFCSYGERREGE